MFGLFKKKKDKCNNKTSMLVWLESADEAYEFACKRKLTSGLGDFFTNNALVYIMNKVAHLDDDYGGLSMYRNVVFKKIKTKDGSLQYRRDITYDDIMLSKNVSVPTGVPYSEKWKLLNNGQISVTDITEVLL